MAEFVPLEGVENIKGFKEFFAAVLFGDFVSGSTITLK
jgi:hypothetical protein